MSTSPVVAVSARMSVTWAAVMLTFVLPGPGRGPVAACPLDGGEHPVQAENHPSQAQLEAAFADAAAEFGVPVEILRAVAFVESRWVQEGPTIDQGWGIMHLVSNGYADTLGEAAALLNLPADQLRTDALANIRGGAALIAHYAAQTAGKPAALEDYWEALKRFSGLMPAVQEKQSFEYFRTLSQGDSGINTLGMHIVIAPVPVNMQSIYSRMSRFEVQSADYGPALWDPSPNYTSGRSASIDRWVNHWIGAGTYAGTISWFKNPSSGVSAHFVIRKSDGEITQMVRVADTAWHATTYNSRSIGVEHEATPSNPWPPDNSSSLTHPMLVASTDLARHFCNLYGIPKTRTYIIGHQEVPGASTECPGPLPWNTWMQLLGGDPPPQTDNAVFVSSTVPSTLQINQTVNVSITFQNTGNTTWTAAGGYKLGAVGDNDPFTSTTRISLASGDSIAYGGQKTFNLTLTAPATPGTYITDWRMIREGVSWFGETFSRTITVTGPPPQNTNNAQFISSTIPTQMQPGESVMVNVTFKNTGTTTWTRSAGYRLGAVGDSDPFISGNRIELATSDSIGPGQQKTFTFQFTAPAGTGSYVSDWRMVQDGVEWFGETHFVNVTVSGGSGSASGRRNLITRNPGFDDFPGGDWKEPYDWAMIWGDYNNDWFWRPGNSYCSYNTTCGWCIAANQGRLAIRPGANRNVLIGQQGWEMSSQYPWANPLSDMGFTGSTRLVCKVWRKTCRNNLFIGWAERENQWTNYGGNAQFKIRQGGDLDNDSAEGDVEYRDWTNSWCRWVGGLVGVHEGGYDPNGRFTLFDDYWLSFEVAARYVSRDVPSEIWAGTTATNRWFRFESFGWDGFGVRTGDWRLKTRNDDAKRIALNGVPAGDQNAQTSINVSGDFATFYFTVHGYMGPGHNPDGDNYYGPEFYLRREGSDAVDCVKWDDNPSGRARQLTTSFGINVKGHKPAVLNLTAAQLGGNPNIVRATFNGRDRKNENVTFTTVQYRIGAGGTWNNATAGSPSSTLFTDANPQITLDWNAASDLGGQSRNEVYFRIQVSDGVYTSDMAQAGPFAVVFSGGSSFDGATLISNTIPSTMSPGQTVSASVTFQNTGTTTWTAGGGYKLGAVGDSDYFAATRHTLGSGESIAPGQQKTFTFNFTAPGAPGTYPTDWQMVREGVAWFGEVCFKNVTVTGSAGGGGRRNLIQYNPSFDNYPGQAWKEPYDWRAIWPGTATDNWWWRIDGGSQYCGNNSLCGWCADHHGKLGLMPLRNENFLIGQQGWGQNDPYPMRNPLSDMGFRGRTRLVAKAWRKTCRNNLFLGWCERENQWSDYGGNVQFKLRQGGNLTDNNTEGDVEHKDWTNDWCRWVGGLVGIHEGDYQSSGRLTMFDDYWLAFEVAAAYSAHDAPGEIWAGEVVTNRWVRLTSFGWDNFGHRTGDWRMKSLNHDGTRIALNNDNGPGQNCQISLVPSGNDGTFFFHVYGYRHSSHNPDGDNYLGPEFYFRREGGDDVDCVKWHDTPGNREVRLRWGFGINVKGHKPGIRNLVAAQKPGDPNFQRLTFRGHDRRGDAVTLNLAQYRIGAGGTWTNATHTGLSSNVFTAADPTITMDWNAYADLGGVSRNGVYFRLQVSDNVYTGDITEVGPFDVIFELLPVITQQPQPQSVCLNQSATFTAAASGSNLAYRWQRNGADLTDGGAVSGAGTATLHIAAVTPAHEGFYRCKVSNAAGPTYTDEVPLIIKPATAVITHPSSQALCPGTTAQFSIEATGSGTLAYRWQRNNVDLSNGGRISGADTGHLQITGLQAADAGEYRCLVTGDCGTMASNQATLTVKAPTVIGTHPAAQTRCLGGTVSFSVAATGSGPLYYQWQKNGVNLVNGGRITGALAATLQITGLDPADAGNYRCIVTGECGTTTSDEAGLTLIRSSSDLDNDCRVDGDDLLIFLGCRTGDQLGPPTGPCAAADLDGDNDVDMEDFGRLQRCMGWPTAATDPACSE